MKKDILFVRKNNAVIFMKKTATIVFKTNNEQDRTLPLDKAVLFVKKRLNLYRRGLCPDYDVPYVIFGGMQYRANEFLKVVE